MKRYNDFDKEIKSIFRDHINMKSPKNLFENTWMKYSKNEGVAVSSLTKHYKTGRTAIAVVCCLAVALTTFLAFSEKARTTVYEAASAVLGVEKQVEDSNVVDKNENNTGNVEAISEEKMVGSEGIPVTAENEALVKQKLGFDYILPESINGSFKKTETMMAIMAFGNPNELEKKRDTLNKALMDDTVFDSIKDYRPQRYISCHYPSEKNGFGAALTICKSEGRKWMSDIENTKIQLIEINGVPCEIMEMKNSEIQLLYAITWELFGKRYYFAFDCSTIQQDKTLDMETAKQFIAKYIKELEQKELSK
ncbi:MAG: hypothetical protein N2645_02430 [Clostridia bacterium]|nr:hypothetical protein [Clostridia bacterium]